MTEPRKPRRPEKGEWVVLGQPPHLATCQRCGGTVAHPPGMIPMSAFLAYLNYAIELHANCEEQP